MTEKTIYTLKRDIEHVLSTGEGWTDEISAWVGFEISKSTSRQLVPRGNYTANLRMSNLGQPCDRKLWYSLQTWANEYKEVLAPYTLNKFIFGDIIEAWTLGLIRASGHKLEGLQTSMTLGGIKGSRDCVIDGMTVDVKSASTMGMAKFRNNGLLDSDPFGYLSQLSSYVAAGKDDPVVTFKNHGAFVAIDKQFGHIEVDIYDMTDLVARKPAEVEEKKAMVKQPDAPARAFSDVPDGKSGNRKLGTQCSYCEYKKACWPDLKTYVYSNGPRYLTQVVREPKVFQE